MSQQEVKISYADPTAFGVIGLAVICFVASSAKLGWTNAASTALLVPWAALLGGIVQIVASGIDFKKGNLFGGTALGTYGFFWVAMAFTWATMNGTFGEAAKAAVDPKQLAFVFLAFLFFSLYITVASFETNVPFMFILVLIDVLFLTLALSAFKINPAVMGKIAGWSEFSISIFGFYASAAIFFKNFYGREILPLGKPLGLIKKATPAPVPTQNIRA